MKNTITPILSLYLFSTFFTKAALILTVNEYTTDRLHLSISGSFDADVIGWDHTAGVFDGPDSFDGFGIKNDWTSFSTQPTELFSGTPLITFSSVAVNGLIYESDTDEGGFGFPYADTIYFEHPFDDFVQIEAGDIVSGSIILDGVGMFDPSDIGSIQLVSGSDVDYNYTRLEATAVPEPSGVTLTIFSLASLFLCRRKR